MRLVDGEVAAPAVLQPRVPILLPRVIGRLGRHTHVVPAALPPHHLKERLEFNNIFPTVYDICEELTWESKPPHKSNCG